MYAAKDIVNAFLLTVAFAVGLVLLGCERKETVLDVDTPDGAVSVERDIDDGSISIDIDE